MLNQVVLVGRLAKEVELKKLEDGRNVAYITLACPRSYKNAEGVYDTDFIKCILWDSIADNTQTYCKKGDVIGIKGRIQCNDETDDKNEIVAEKVTFLSSRKPDEEGEK